MACTPQWSDRIAAFAAGRLPSGEVEELLDHVEGCPTCSAELDTVADVVSAADRADSALSEGTANWTWRRLAPLSAAAAVLLVAGALWLNTVSPSTGVSELARLDPIAAEPAWLRASSANEGSRELEVALAAYARGDFAAAAQALSPLVEAHPEDALAHLYLGVALLQVDRTDEALSVLDVAARAGTGLVQERALWYAANAQLALDDADGAQERLEELVSIDGDYRLNAEDLLELLGPHLRR